MDTVQMHKMVLKGWMFDYTFSDNYLQTLGIITEPKLIPE